jgi:hypothetical protein
MQLVLKGIELIVSLTLNIAVTNLIIFKELSMSKNKKAFLISFLTVFWAGIMFAGCITTPSPQPGDDNLRLPYTGAVATSGSAFSITNTGKGSGILGLASGKRGWGIVGDAVSTEDEENYGGFFRAWGKKGHGVHAVAMNTEYVQNYGGYFEALGKKGIGVFALARNTENVMNYGGYFSAQGYHGRGVWGQATGDHGWGVSGVAFGKKSRAVYGEATNDGDDKNYGGYFVARGKNGRGIFAQGGPSGYAAEFNGTVTTKVLEITGGADLSEVFDVRTKENLVPAAGMVVSIDTDNHGKLIVSQQAYDRSVAGIISGAGNIEPGMILGQSNSDNDADFKVALTGRVYCLADASNGVIRPGDLLTTSSIPGYAMKVTDYSKAQGAIIGKAMSRLISGHGLVLVLVSLQ